MIKLIKGKLYLTGDTEDDLVARKFLAVNSRGVNVFESSQIETHNRSYSWKIIKEIPEPQENEWIKWNKETIPLDGWFVDVNGNYLRVLEVGIDGVYFEHGYKTYRDLLKNCKYIPDINHRDRTMACGDIVKPEFNRKVKVTFLSGGTLVGTNFKFLTLSIFDPIIKWVYVDVD